MQLVVMGFVGALLQKERVGERVACNNEKKKSEDPLNEATKSKKNK